MAEVRAKGETSLLVGPQVLPEPGPEPRRSHEIKELQQRQASELRDTSVVARVGNEVRAGGPEVCPESEEGDRQGMALPLTLRRARRTIR